MPIKHTVLLKFKPSVTQAEIEAMRDSLAGLQQDIPQILSFTWCENNSPENLHHDYLHGFSMEFKNDADRAIYLAHPLHVSIAQQAILPKLVDGINTPIVFDYYY